MTWQLWQRQHRQPAPPSRTLVLDKLKSGDDCCCRVCFRMNLQKPSHSERFSFLTKFHSSLSFNNSGWYCWQNTDMPCRPLLLVSLDFLLLFLLDFFHALVKHWYDSCMHKNSTPQPSICQGSPWNRGMMGQIALWLLFYRNELDHLFAVSVQMQLLLPKCNWWEITQISGIGLGEPNADIYFRNCR